MVGSRGFALRVLTRVQIGTITLQNNLPLSSDIEHTRTHDASAASLRCPPWRIPCVWRQEGRVISPGELVTAKHRECKPRLAESRSPILFSFENKPSVGTSYNNTGESQPCSSEPRSPNKQVWPAAQPHTSSRESIPWESVYMNFRMCNPEQQFLRIQTRGREVAKTRVCQTAGQ